MEILFSLLFYIQYFFSFFFIFLLIQQWLLRFYFEAEVQITAAAEYNYTSMRVSLFFVFPILANISICAIIYTFPLQTQRIINTKAISFDMLPQYNYRISPLQSVSDQKHYELTQKILKQLKEQEANKNKNLAKNTTAASISESKIVPNVTLLANSSILNTTLNKLTEKTGNVTNTNKPIVNVTYQIRPKKQINVQNPKISIQIPKIQTVIPSLNQSKKSDDQNNTQIKKIKNQKQQTKIISLNRVDDQIPVIKNNSSVSSTQQKFKGRQEGAQNKVPDSKLQSQGTKTNLVKQTPQNNDNQDRISLINIADKVQIISGGSSGTSTTSQIDFTQKILAALRNGTLGMADPNDTEFEFLKREDSKDLVKKIVEEAKNFTLGNIPFE